MKNVPAAGILPRKNTTRLLRSLQVGLAPGYFGPTAGFVAVCIGRCPGLRRVRNDGHERHEETFLRLTARPIFKIVLPLAVALAAVAGPCKASHIGVFTNWDYEIGHGAFTTREQDALLRYAAGQCEPVRRVSSQGTIAKVPLKSK